MRIALSLGGKLQYTASLEGTGFLSAHLNLANRTEDGVSKRVRVNGYDTNSPTETVSLSWPELKLDVGDVVQLEILGEGPGDPPVQRRSTTESPTNLLSNAAVAKELLAACRHFESRLLEIMKNASTIEPEEEYRKLKLAIGNVFMDLGEHMLSPVYRRHPELIPEPMKGRSLW